MMLLSALQKDMPKMWKYKEARKIFLDAPQIEAPELRWSEPDEEALVEFLCRNHRIKCVVTKTLFCLYIICICVSETILDCFFLAYI